MKQNKNNEHIEIWAELESIASKGYTNYILPDKNKRDKRKFMKIHITELDFIANKSGIDKKYINFFILLVNINVKHIEPDTNLIKLSVKEIAEKMGYSVVHTYNTLNILEKINLIGFYRVGRNKYVVINPKYFAKFYNIRFMYAVEYCFEERRRKTNIQEIIGKISILKDLKTDRENNKVKSEVKCFINNNIW